MPRSRSRSCVARRISSRPPEGGRPRRLPVVVIHLTLSGFSDFSIFIEFSLRMCHLYLSNDSIKGHLMSSTTAEPSVLATSRGKLILILLCSVGFLDLIDVTIVNVALPAIRDDLGFSVQ